MLIWAAPTSVAWMVQVMSTTAFPSRRISARSASSCTSAGVLTRLVILEVEPLLELLVVVEVRDRVLGGDLEEQEGTPRGRGPDLAEVHPRRGVGDDAEVVHDPRPADELAVLPDAVAEVLLRRGDRLR